MRTYDEIISENNLPTKEQLEDITQQIQLFNWSFTFIPGNISNAQVLLDMESIAEFLDFAKEHNVSEIIGTVIPFSEYSYYISQKDFEDDAIEPFIQTLVSNYNLDLDEYSQLRCFIRSIIDAFPKEDSEETNKMQTFLEPLAPLENYEDEEYDDLYPIYTRTSIADQLYQEIVQANNNVPDIIKQLSAKIMLGCSIDGIIYTCKFENKIDDFDTTERLYNILISYKNMYQSQKLEQQQKEEKELLEQEQAMKKQQEDKQYFLELVANDIRYKNCTNETQRIMFIDNLCNGKIDEKLLNAFLLAYPNKEDKVTQLSKNAIREIIQEIKMNTL